MKAEGFLMDALKTYKQEGWDLLAAHCRLELADCQLQAQCHDRYVTQHQKKLVTIHQLTTMLSTSKNVLFPGHNYLLTSSADIPSLGR